MWVTADIRELLRKLAGQLAEKFYVQLFVKGLDKSEINKFNKIVKLPKSDENDVVRTINDVVTQLGLTNTNYRQLRDVLKVMFSGGGYSKVVNVMLNELREMYAAASSKERFNDELQEYKKVLQEHLGAATKEILKSHGKKTAKEKTGTEAPEDAPLGKIAFAPFRDDVNVYEPNTQIEQELYDDLSDKINDNTHLGAQHAQLIVQMAKKGYYSTVFHPPTQDTVYRGMVVTPGHIEQWLEENIDSLRAKHGKDLFGLTLHKKFTVKPRVQTQRDMSWSLSEDVAVRFAGEAAYYGDIYPGSIASVSVIVAASVSENPHKFFVGPGGFYKVDQLDSYTDEQEVLSIGDIVANSITVYIHDSGGKENAKAFDAAESTEEKKDVIDDILSSLGY